MSALRARLAASGDLDPNVWGVSRATGNANFGVGQYNGWAATTQNTTAVIQSGLKAGQLVVTDGQMTLKPNAPVSFPGQASGRKGAGGGRPSGGKPAA